MTKADLIDLVASKADIPKQKAEEIVNGVFDDIVAALKNGDKVNISGFGTFAVSQRKARTGRNPKTGCRGRTKANAKCVGFGGRLAQWESIGLTSRGSQVQVLYRPPG